ncbi:MAG: uracil-DNA glycosylase [Candidatus Cloacimonadaceae bacterium]|nr:uracil-DNA glycosylase [Candidatus Cloacimonadaceae bacterium]MDP3114794.1 uracil-DNA glycosylase [Candidatus Cloacimonadaceae bacterium]
MSNRAIKQQLELLRNSGIHEIYAPVSDKAKLLGSLKLKYANCTKCALHTGRNLLVYGEGDPNAIAMIIGEAPGEQENQSGRPFVGAAGGLLERMLLAINLTREQVYIANIVKCRPPGNRNPDAGEREACLPYLIEQIGIIQPRIFLFLGLVAAQTLLQAKGTLESLRLERHEFCGIRAFVTYHPAALLRNENWKRPAWEDLQEFQKEYIKLQER